ncbi:MAG: hypothetical protein WAV47_10345 [Blastocatellia bacterium]
MLILSESDLRAVLTMREVIEAVEHGFRAIGGGLVKVPERLRLDVHRHHGIVLEMPAYLDSLDGDDPGALGTKIVSVFPDNAPRGLDVIQASFLLLDSETGTPLSLMDGRFITAVRTAATSAVATKFMATAGAKRAAVFGAGVQAEFHVEAMIEAAEVERVMIVSRNRERATGLAQRVSTVHGLPCDIETADQAASTANLICTCTSSPTPLFDGKLLTQGAHINAVGAFSPSTRELDTETVLNARVIIDAQSAAGREAGELLIPLSEGLINAAHIKGTLADVVCGRVAGRESASEITIFKSCGLAIEDLVTARLAYSRAVIEGIGITVEM